MRVTNRLLAGLLALALLAGGVLAGVEIVYGNATGEPLVVPWDQWFDGAAERAWSSREVRSLLLLVLAAGVLLVVLQVVRRGPQSVPVDTAGAGNGAVDTAGAGDAAGEGDGDRRAALTVEANTRSLEKAVVRALGALDGVDRAKVSFSLAQVEANVRTSRRELGGLEQAARQALAARLATAGVRRPERVNVRIRRTRAAQRAVEEASGPPAGENP